MRLYAYLHDLIGCAHRGQDPGPEVPAELASFLKRFVADQLRQSVSQIRVMAPQSPDGQPATPNGLSVEWSLDADAEAYIALSARDEKALLKYAEETGVDVLEAGRDPLVAALEQLHSHVRSFDHSYLTARRLAALLEDHAQDWLDELDLNGITVRRVDQGFPGEDGVVLAPTDPAGLDEVDHLGASTWDTLGSTPSGPMTGNPGFAQLWLWDDRLFITTDWAQPECVLGSPLPKRSANNYTGLELATAMSEFYQMFINGSTYAVHLELPNEEIPRFLHPATHVGVIKVNGRWWHRIEGHWQSSSLTGEVPAPMPPASGTVILTLRPLGEWEAYRVSALLVSPQMEDVRLPLALLACHKGNGYEQTPVGIVRVDVLEARPWYGVAISDYSEGDIPSSVAPLVGASVVIRETSDAHVGKVEHLGTGRACHVQQRWRADDSGVDVLAQLPELLEQRVPAERWRGVMGGELQQGVTQPSEETSVRGASSARDVSSSTARIIAELPRGAEGFLADGSVVIENDYAWVDPKAPLVQSGLRVIRHQDGTFSVGIRNYGGGKRPRPALAIRMQLLAD